MADQGLVRRVNGSLVMAEGLPKAKIGDVVHIGQLKLIGEIVRMKGSQVSLQCYEDTSGLKPGEPVLSTGMPLSAELGPGLIGNIFDGLQFSEIAMMKLTGAFVGRGAKASRLDRNKQWPLTPRVKVGQKVSEGDVVGTIPETSVIEHRVLVPVGLNGIVTEIKEGDFTVEESIGVIETSDKQKIPLKLMQRWPVRVARPCKVMLPSVELLVTGQRVIDSFFPVCKGGTAAIPGGFGTGKTITLHQLAKWSEANIIVYIGCGERGNEIADVITHFPELEDPRTGKKISERSIFIANVSNMPVSAREASIYTGITIAEYYRDQGYDVAIMADSTSRWAEALRDISGRLEEIPAEAGFPAYLPERIAEFYERSGRVSTLGSEKRTGSVTIMGAVSPPAGDFSEPVTSLTLRFVGALWALDTELAFRRHFPAINWLQSFSRYADLLVAYWSKIDPDWLNFRDRALSLLDEASKIEETARIIGEKALPEEQRLILFISGIIREGFLAQQAFHEVDTYCAPTKQAKMLRKIIEFLDMTEPLVKAGVPVEKIRELPYVPEIMRLKEQSKMETIDEIMVQVKSEIDRLAKQYDMVV